MEKYLCKRQPLIRLRGFHGRETAPNQTKVPVVPVGTYLGPIVPQLLKNAQTVNTKPIEGDEILSSVYYVEDYLGGRP